MKYFKYGTFYLVEYDDSIDDCFRKQIPCKVLKQLKPDYEFIRNTTGEVILFHKDTLTSITEEEVMLEML